MGSCSLCLGGRAGGAEGATGADFCGGGWKDLLGSSGFLLGGMLGALTFLLRRACRILTSSLLRSLMSVYMEDLLFFLRKG